MRGGDVKPWEQEWRTSDVRPGAIEVGDAMTVQVQCAFWRVPSGDAEAFRQAKELEAFVLAAPAGFRALLANGETRGNTWHAYGCETGEPLDCPNRCHEARMALRRAGMLP